MSFNIGSSMFTAENKYRTPREKMQRELMIKREVIDQQNKITNEISERAMMQYEAEKELAELRRIIAIKQTQNEIYLEEEEKKDIGLCVTASKGRRYNKIGYSIQNSLF